MKATKLFIDTGAILSGVIYHQWEPYKQRFVLSLLFTTQSKPHLPWRRQRRFLWCVRGLSEHRHRFVSIRDVIVVTTMIQRHALEHRCVLRSMWYYGVTNEHISEMQFVDELMCRYICMRMGTTACRWSEPCSCIILTDNRMEMIFKLSYFIRTLLLFLLSFVFVYDEMFMTSFIQEMRPKTG